MDQLDIYERLQELIDRYEAIVDTHMDQLEMQTLLLLSKYYSRYGDSIREYTKYSRLQSFQQELNQLTTEQYTALAQDVQTGAEDTFKESYLLYAYLLHQSFGVSDDGEVLPLTKAAAKTSVAIAIVLLLLKAAKVPSVFFTDNQVSIADVLTKHKNDYAYNVLQDVKQNLRAAAGQTDAMQKVQKRIDKQRGYSRSYVSELYNDVMNFATDKIHDIIQEQTTSEKFWLSMRDRSVREEHRLLDSQKADKDGYFHYGAHKAKRPKTFGVPHLDYGCRCKVILLFNGALPRTSKVYDYTDKQYNEQLQKKISELRKANNKMTYAQALREASGLVKPPKRTVKGYLTYEEWRKQYGADD